MRKNGATDVTEKEKRDAELQALDDEVYSEVLNLRLTPWGPMKFTPALLFMPAMSARTCRSYSTDIAAAWDMEEEIQRRGLVAEYGEAMSILLDNPFVTASFYDFLHASRELRCRAALSCVRAAKDTPPTK